MVTAYDANPHQLIRATAVRLEKVEGLAAPKWVGMVKSGAHRERLPQDDKFWYVRCASLLYQAYCHSPIGVSSLQTHYGGRQKRGVARERFARAGGNMIRKGLQAMEKAGLLTKKKVGRYIAPKGQALMDSVAQELAQKKE
ncbi:30S ribosomal protein S19e [uncultured archaeon]|nr:30S ribosomal protein S19e [uncultured archaeon]